MDYDAIYLLLKTRYDDEIIDEIPKICYGTGNRNWAETKVGLDKLQEVCNILVTKHGATVENEILQSIIDENYEKNNH